MVNGETHELWEAVVDREAKESKKVILEGVLGAFKYCKKVGGDVAAELYAEKVTDTMIFAAQHMAGASIDHPLDERVANPIAAIPTEGKLMLDSPIERLLHQTVHFIEETNKKGYGDDLFMAKNYLRLAEKADGHEAPKYQHMIKKLNKAISLLK